MKSLNKLAEKYNQPGVGFNITYNTRTEEPITFTGPEYLNSAVVNGVDKDNQPLHKEVVATLKNFNASWSISGTKNTLHVQKLDSETMQPVGGAVITIYNQQNGKTIEGTTNSEGLVEFSNLDPGNYTLTETKAPKGYEINKQLYLFKVDKDYTVSGFKGTNGKYNMNPVVFDQKEHTSTTTSSTTPITKPSTTTSSKKTSTTKPSTTTSSKKTSTTKPSTTTSSKKTESTTKPSTTTSSKKTVSTTKPSTTTSSKKTSTTKPSTTTSSKKTVSTTKPSKTSSKKTESTTKSSTTTSSKKKTNNQVNSSNQGSTGGAYNITTTTSSHGGSVVNHNNDQGNKSSSDNHGWLPQTGHKKSIIPLTGLGLLLIAIAIAAIVYLRKRKER